MTKYRAKVQAPAVTYDDMGVKSAKLLNSALESDI